MDKTRDFTEKARQELLKMVKEVNEEKYSDFTDWFGDRWLDFEDFIGQLDIEKYINNINSYHKKVIDKNNTTKKEINKIFEDVNNISVLYKGRFSAILVELENYNSILQKMCDTINPNNGNFRADYIGSNLKAEIKKIKDEKKYLNMIVEDGINKEDFDEIPDETRQSILNKYTKTILDNVGKVKVGQKVKIPLGYDLMFYYKVDADIKGKGDVNINLEIEDQKVKLSDLDVSKEMGSISLSSNIKGKSSISSRDDTTKTNNSFSSDGSCVIMKKIKDGDYTYKRSLKENLVTGEFDWNTSIEKNINDTGTISSTVGIKSSSTKWKPVPVPDPVLEGAVEHSKFQMPSFSSIGWEEQDYQNVGLAAGGIGIIYVIIKYGPLLLAI